MDLELTPTELRVLGALMEKAILTPEYYPMSLNGLVNACNQKTSREPVTALEEDEVLRTLDELRERRLVLRVDQAGSRVPKFRERASQEWALSREEYALLTLLMLRGAQTPGQLRARADRLFDFADLEAVEATLQAMRERADPPLVLVQPLPHTPGIREVRWYHTLGGAAPAIESPALGSTGPVVTGPGLGERVKALESEVAELKSRLAALERSLGIGG